MSSLTQIVCNYAIPPFWEQVVEQEDAEGAVEARWKEAFEIMQRVGQLCFQQRALPPFSAEFQGNAFFEPAGSLQFYAPLPLQNAHVVQWLARPSNALQTALLPLLQGGVGRALYTSMVSYPVMPQPTTEALQYHAARFSEKYAIDLRVLSLGALTSSWDAWCKQAQAAPFNLGIIVYEDEPHIVPLVLHFRTAGNQTVVEAAILDNFGILPDKTSYPLAAKMEQSLALLGVSRTQVVRGRANSQADPASCRLGGIFVLRHALLSLKSYPQGLFAALQKLKAPIDQDQCILLPPEWDYTEQVSNKTPRAGTALAIRDRFSQKPCKTLSPRNVAAFRDAYRTSMLFKCQIELDCSQHEERLPALQEMALRERGTLWRPRPESSMVDCTFYAERPINSYLLSKAIRLNFLYEQNCCYAAALPTLFPAQLIRLIQAYTKGCETCL